MSSPDKTLKTRLKTPIGWLAIAATDQGVLSVNFVDSKPAQNTTGHKILDQCLDELDGYFTGSRRQFSVPIVFDGTEFQQNVWRALQRVPFGATLTYGDLARVVRKPLAARAVGGAMNRNRVPLLLPCHRVVGSTGALTGFACGVWRKEWLLKHETCNRA